MIEYSIRTRLLAVSAVTDLVGTGVANARIAVMRMPQPPVFPCITIQVVDDAPEYDLEGEAGLAHARIQVSCWTQDNRRRGYDAYDVARRLADAVQSALSGYTGTVGSHEIQTCFLVGRRVLRDDELLAYHVPVDFRVGYV